MNYAQAKQLDSEAIPVIDITGLRDGSEPQQVAQALHAASQQLGFIYIKGHGIPDEAIEAAREDALAFFRLPDEVKAQWTITPSHRGWLRQGASKMQDGIPADLKESYVWSHPIPRGEAPDQHPFRDQNVWPDAVPTLETHALDYYHHASRVATDLLKGFALGLDLQKGFFLRDSDYPLSRSSFVYYPEQPESSDTEQFGVGPHTDFGVLTVLCQDDTGGLQVQDTAGDWIHATPIEGTLVVNVGDLLSRWTDGAYKSTPHRVINTSGRERISLVLAYDPGPNTSVDARQIFGEDHKPSQDAISCGDYLSWRFNKAFTYETDN